MKYVEAEVIPVTVTAVNSDSRTDGKVSASPKKLLIGGTGFANVTQSDVSFDVAGDAWAPPAAATWTFTNGLITIDNGAEAMSLGGTTEDPFTVTIKGVSCSTTIA